MEYVVDIRKVGFAYPPSRKEKEPRVALRDLSFRIPSGAMFCLLGPNGSGKSTLFRILSTLLQPTSGTATVLGNDVVRQQSDVRRHLGVVFQNPSLDKKLTASENLLHQGHLYGLRGATLRLRIGEMLERVGLSDRADDLVENLSGGMQRRVELAKGLLHRPQLLLMDEPSTGLDPGARIEFTRYLRELRDTEGVTVVLTTHILEEAEQCTRLAILDGGSLVAEGTPAELKAGIGGDVLTIASPDPLKLARLMRDKFGGNPTAMEDAVHLERADADQFIPALVHAFPDLISAITYSKPTVEDVFIDKTGHRFWNQR